MLFQSLQNEKNGVFFLGNDYNIRLIVYACYDFGVFRSKERGGEIENRIHARYNITRKMIKISVSTCGGQTAHIPNNNIY